jgi:predicted nucleic acid-binding protein
VIVDTGVLYAAADTDDTDHERSAGLLTDRSAPLLVPTPVIVETSWLLESRLGPAAELAFLRAVEVGELTRVDLVSDDWTRVCDLVEQYADLGLGLVDASVVAVAERLGTRTVATLNHRDFRVVRPRHCAALDLIP